MRKGLISALLHVLCDVISLLIIEINIANIYRRKMQEYFFLEETLLFSSEL